MSRKKRPSPYGPTQKDVAAALGLAQTTVALALNPKYQHRYSPQTVRRIQEKARELGYRPQRHAQIMRGANTRVVGILVHLGFFESSRQKLDELIIAFRELDYSPVVAEITWFQRNLEAAINYLLDNSVQGLVVVNVAQPCDLTPILMRNLPVVLLNCNLQSLSLPSVNESIEEGFLQLTRHHIAQGSRYLVQCGNQRSTDPVHNQTLGYTVRERLTGFIKAIHQAGGTIEFDFAGYDLAPLVAETLASLPKPKRRIRGLKGKIFAPPLSPERQNIFDVGRYAAHTLMCGANPPDSVVCDNDDLAIGFLRGCLDLGIAVPRQVRLSGYDASTAGAYAAVPLTTYRAHNALLAKRAAQLLVAMHNRQPVGEPNQRVPGELIVRESTVIH